MRLAPAAALAGAALSGCALIGGSETAKPVAGFSDGLAAAVFRYQFAHNASAHQSAVAIYCIGYGSNPGPEVIYGPSQKLLALLADIKPHVAAYTACAIDPAHGVVEKGSGAAGLLFKIATVSCSSAERCIVHGGYYEGYLSATSNSYFLKKRGHKWIVLGDKDDWVS